MYPARLGIDEAKKRIKALMTNGHDAEALLTAYFTFEKTVYRTLRRLIVSSGLSGTDADNLLKHLRGLEKYKQVWSVFDSKSRTLPDIIGNEHWQHVKEASKMRNALVHGRKVYKLERCEKMAENMLGSIDRAVTIFKEEYNYCGWVDGNVRKKRKSKSRVARKTPVRKKHV